MDKRLLEILVCPACKQKLEYRSKEKELVCLAEGLAYRIDDGIPVLLEDEARKLDAEKDNA